MFITLLNPLQVADPISVGRVVEVLAAMADHHLAQVCVPAEVQAQGAVLGVLGTDLEVLPHLHGLAAIGEGAGTPGLRVALDRLRFPGRIAVGPEHLAGHHVRCTV